MTLEIIFQIQFFLKKIPWGSQGCGWIFFVARERLSSPHGLDMKIAAEAPGWLIYLPKNRGAGSPWKINMEPKNRAVGR